jgi:perosamine synthetase
MSFIPVSQPLLNGNEKKYLNECIDSGWISSEGPFVQRLEDQFATYTGRQYGIAVSSGSAALDIAIAALKIGSGDEVIIPTFTIISCATAVVRSGATPVVVDCDPITWNIDVNQIEAKISPRTKAIMAVHIYGLPVDMDPLLALAHRYGLWIVEDAAEVHGQVYRSKSCGSFGIISIFSFYANKNVTASEGGILLTDDEVLAERCRSLRNLCMQPEQRFIHSELGWNYRMGNLQAAVGVAQFERLHEIIARRREIGEIYTNLLRTVSCLQLPLSQTDYAQNIYWAFSVVLQDDVSYNAKQVTIQLKNNGIQTRPFFWPMHLQPIFLNMGLFENENCPVSEKIAHRGFYLPNSLAITEQQIDSVVKTLKSILGFK